MIESTTWATTATPQDIWVRSSWCTPNSNCMEVSVGAQVIHVRDSKNAYAGNLNFDRRQWSSFLAVVTS